MSALSGDDTPKMVAQGLVVQGVGNAARLFDDHGQVLISLPRRRVERQVGAGREVGEGCPDGAQVTDPAPRGGIRPIARLPYAIKASPLS